jgi:hypothetical protein
MTDGNVNNEETQHPKTGCGILGRYPIISVVAFVSMTKVILLHLPKKFCFPSPHDVCILFHLQASCGIALGVGLSLWEPDDQNAKDVTLQWVGLVGDMFIRALKAIVLPLVFVNVIISVVDMMSIGRASSVGWKTLGLYTLTTLIASVIGLIAIVAFNGRFEEGNYDTPEPAYVKLGCEEEGQFLTEIDSNGSIQCAAEVEGADTNNLFIIDDFSSSFVRVSSGPSDDISLSDTIYDGVFTKLIVRMKHHLACEMMKPCNVYSPILHL